jgi:hypothetical protein
MGAIVDIQMRPWMSLLEDRKIALDLDENAANGWPTRATTRPMARVR